MKIRIPGPIPIQFEMNALMFSGVLLGGLGIAVWALAHYAGLPSGLPWDDIAIGVTLLGIALYFLGRLVDLVAYLRRRR
jgi:hypothetical protein